MAGRRVAKAKQKGADRVNEPFPGTGPAGVAAEES